LVVPRTVVRTAVQIREGKNGRKQKLKIEERNNNWGGERRRSAYELRSFSVGWKKRTSPLRSQRRLFGTR